MNAAHGADTDMNLLATACVFRKDRRQTMFGSDRDGRLVHIDAAPRQSSDFVCPDCGSPLIVRKGDRNIHHFAHKSHADCISAGETALHQVAKDILRENRALMLPELVILDEICQQEREVLLDSVEEETWEGRFRPDLRATMRGTEDGSEVISTLYIEIHVTHVVDREKLEKIEARGRSAIEIDLSRLNRDLTREDLSLLVRRDAPRKWLYHRRADAHRSNITAARELARQIQAEADAKEQRCRDEAAQRVRRARLREPARSAPDTSRAQRRWQAIGRDSVFRMDADDAIFELPPRHWRAIALDALAPWANQNDRGAHCRLGMLDAMAHQAVRSLLSREAVKNEFVTKGTAGGGPALDAVRAYLKAVITMVGDIGTWGSEFDIHRALQDIRRDWISLKEVHDKVTRLQAMLRDQEIVLTGCGRAMVSIDDTANWIAARRGRANLSIGSMEEPLRLLIFELENERSAAGVPAERLLGMELALHRSGKDCTADHLQDLRLERDARLTAETWQTIEAEVDRILMPLEKALDTLTSIGPWPSSVTLDALPSRAGLREIVWVATGEYYKRHGIVYRSAVDKATGREMAIIRTFAAIALVVNDLGLPLLERGLRNVLVRHVIRQVKTDAGILAFDRLADALSILASSASRLAQEELAGSRRVQGTSPENFAWRAMRSPEKAGGRCILQSVLHGDIVTARRLTNLAANPMIKPAWIRADTPRFE
ncbi:competence protein CoiA family protein [Paracoccus sp. ME4]|uniref:competence protein CoiA family protein n=1 Tax=Paracoccus sp. ME4 TaxID=3138066 RepID=UPI00398B4C96